MGGSKESDRPASHGGRVSMVVVTPSSVDVHPMPAEGEIVLGRAPDCDVPLSDSRVSRAHVRVRLGPEIVVEDLGSANGTRVGDRRLTPGERYRVALGDTIALGSTTITFEPTNAGPVDVAVRLSRAELEGRIEREIARANGGGAGFAILRIEIPRLNAPVAVEITETTPRALVRLRALNSAMVSVLRPNDAIRGEPDYSYEVLIADASIDECERLALEMQESIVASGFQALVGVACFRRDGATREALEARARDGLRPPAPDEPLPAPVAALGTMRRLAPIVERVASATINVLILGETGVGKEVMARTIHEQSPRRGRPLVCLNCAALSESLLESELFGHERGAFTGALKAKPGLLESAEGGSAFLDEVGEMPLSIQAKLLRVLEQREVLRVGALRPTPIDVRFIAATNRDLEAEVAAKRFRQDLYFRLNGLAIEIPPLRERSEEIEPLARAFVAKACEGLRRAPVLQLAPQVVALLKGYPWPGNIRELRNVMERAVILATGNTITLEHLPAAKMTQAIARKDREARQVARRPAVPMLAGAQNEKTDQWDALTEKTSLKSIANSAWGALPERERIVAALDECQGNQTVAAKLLGISRRTLVTRLGEFGLPRPRKKD